MYLDRHHPTTEEVLLKMINRELISHHLTFSENADYEYHFHLYYEILYVTEGEINIYSNGKNATLKTGDVCVIPAFTPHRTTYKNAVVSHITFDSLYIDKYLSRESLNRLHEEFSRNITISSKKNISENIEALINEIDNFNGEMAYIYIYIILLGCSPIYKNKDISNMQISKVMNYIGVNSKDKLSLDDISKECGISKYHICRLFRNEFGITPVDYITFAKMRRAVTKLKNSNLTISKISDGLSFFSPKYFTKIFKSYFGVSPKEFRGGDNMPERKIYYLKAKKNE